MLYAAVCSGSYASFLDLRLVNRLGFQDQITETDQGHRAIKLPMYLPEAVPVSASSHASSPAPQLPSITVEFTVVEHRHDETDSKAIQIFLGSDMLRAHNADILLSSNQLTLYDDDRDKLRIPLVRPEDEHTFKSLYITSGPRDQTQRQPRMEPSSSVPAEAVSSPKEPTDDAHAGLADRSSAVAAKVQCSTATSGSEDGSTGRRSLEKRPRLGLSLNLRSESKDAQEPSSGGTVARGASSPAIWGNWRRDTEKSGSTEWASLGKTPAPTYQRRDTGIKVLKKPGARTTSMSVPQGSSPSVTGQSRFFDDGKRRADNLDEGEGGVPPLKRSVSAEKPKENNPVPAKNRAANPVGGASAFPWLNTGGLR